MARKADLEVLRRAYAKQVLAAAQLEDPRLEAAYAAVRREDFLGPGPWRIPRWGAGYVATPSDDPVYLYIDSVVQILGDRHINNGQPSGHAKWIASAAIAAGEHVVHIGAGTGYYSAIMAQLAGSPGRVTAIEIDPALAERARQTFAAFPSVRVVHGDGVTASFGDADVIYVNAGVTHPVETWLDQLAEGGRLILPLTTDSGFMNRNPALPIERSGGVFRIARQGRRFLANWISPVGIVPCEGARDPACEAALAEAFQRGGWDKVTRLRRGRESKGGKRCCWLRAPGWSLTCE